MNWQTNFKSMSFEQLLAVKLEIGLTRKMRDAQLAFIASELRIKAPAREPASQEALDWAALEIQKVDAFKATNHGWEKECRDARAVTNGDRGDAA